MAIQSGRSAFLSLLADEGVNHLFGNPGTTEIPIMEALSRQSDVQYVLGLQEGAVMAMAEGYARASGSLAACNVHVAPGLGNAMGSLYNAKFSGAPVIVAAGQHSPGMAVTDPPLYDNLVAMAQPLVKWAFEPNRLQDLPRVMRRAAKIALTPPTGPVFISLPGDILEDEGEFELGTRTRVDVATRPSDTAISNLADRLLAARNPIMLAGHELSTRDAWKQAEQLAELLGIPVYHQTFLWSAAYSSQHPAYMGVYPLDQAKSFALLEQHDLLVVIGGDAIRMASVPSTLEPMPAGYPVVHISERDWELGKIYPTEIALRANVKDTLAALLPVLASRRSPERAAAATKSMNVLAGRNWTATRQQLVKSVAGSLSAKPIDPRVAMMQLSDHLAPGTAVVEEALTSGFMLPGFMAFSDPKSYYGPTSGSIGFAVPGAVGISLASPGRPVLVIVGDGSAMYNIQALWTAANLRLPITYVVVNNRGYRILKERLARRWKTDKFVGMDFREPPIDFVSLAASMGVKARRVEDPADLVPALREAQAAGEPRLIDLIVQNGFGA